MPPPIIYYVFFRGIRDVLAVVRAFALLPGNMTDC